jgi:hypothetical protein
VGAGGGDRGGSARCAACATITSARRRGRRTVTSDASGVVSDEPGCGDWAIGCEAPQEEQNRAVSAFELPQFRHSMSVSLAFEVQSRCGCRETVRLSRREADLSSAPADFAR